MMKTTFRPGRLLAPLLLSCLLASPGARAASMLIDAGNIEELVTFTFGQFEGGFSINGSTPTSGGSFTFGEGTQLNFTGQWIDLGQATAFSRTVYWVEPQAPTVISEILQWSITPSGASGLATISGFFQAEGLGTLPPGVLLQDVIVEQFDGSHDPFQFSAPFLVGQIITGPGDVGGQPCGVGPFPPCTASEPGVAALSGLGLLVVLGAAVRRRRSARAA